MSDEPYDEETKRMLKEYEEAVADEQEAASRASFLADELQSRGVPREELWEGRA